MQKTFAGSLVFFFSGLHLLFGQIVPTPEYQVKAVFLFNFTQFIEWPTAAFNNREEPFIIGILGEDPFGSYLDETIAGERVMGHPLVVQRYATLKEVRTCHMLFIQSSDPKTMKATLEVLASRHVLTVSDMHDFARLGGTIGFVTQANKIRFQIKLSNAKESGLNISSKLLRLADIID